MNQDVRTLLVAPNQGEVERLANLLREYELPYRLGSRIQHAGSENIYDESSYLAGDLRTPVILRTASPPASACLTRASSSSARRISSTKPTLPPAPRPKNPRPPPSSPTSATSPSAITSSTLSTASRATRACAKSSRTASRSSS